MANLFKEEFKNYHKLLIIGFIGGVISWIFTFTFESLMSQIENIWTLLGGSFIVTLVWYFIFSIPFFFILKFFGLNFKE
jgi:hypothetical protein